MFLIINTSEQNRTIIGLIKGPSFIAKKTWQTKYHDSEKLLPEIKKLFKKSLSRAKNLVLGKNNLTQLKGIIIVNGPGAFSSVRAGVIVANTLAYALNIPVAGVKLTEFKNLKELAKIGERRLKKNKGVNIVEPFYGKEPNITKSRKK